MRPGPERLQARLSGRTTAFRACAHPIVVSAALLILVNDLALRGHAPGALTGKLSDVGWLVVVPVLAAAGLEAAGVARTRARRLALAGVAAFFVALQLWPPLGAALKPGHVADAEDLWTLPALAGAIVAWKGPRRPAWIAAGAVPLLAGALLADSFSTPPDASWPCGDEMAWNAADPLRFQLDGWSPPPVDTDAFLRGVRLTDESGADVPLVLARTGWLEVAACARDGLRGNMAYTWEIGPWEATPSNEVAYVRGGLPPVHFRTTSADGPAVGDATACAALVEDLPRPVERQCDPWAHDTGDTATDTGDSGR